MKTIKIKDLPEEQRPRERMWALGAEALNDAELIALILGTGTKSESALLLAQRLLKGDGGKSGLEYIYKASLEELANNRGIGSAKAVKIKAAVELGRRIASNFGKKNIIITSPKDIDNLLREEMRLLEKEHFKVILLDTKNKVISIEDISIGTVDASIVHPREVFKPAIKRSSSSIILVHNHPSGDPYPSKEDLVLTKRLSEAGKLLGIYVLDHVIIGNTSFSFKENALLD
ncbi:MAG: RadC family protein [Thermovenabulum sp.]|uniref:RadC family protein n=1 Tax=Thermovenabulum sp. TaxID=3100335 RepID=UPI003C7E5B78